MKEPTFDAVRRALDAVQGGELSLEDQLIALQIAWLGVAEMARSAMLHVPEGFTDIQAEQLRHLDGMKVLVSGAEPDLELERLCREGDWDGAVAHLEKLHGTADREPPAESDGRR